MFGVAVVLFLVFLKHYYFVQKDNFLYKLQCVLFDKNTVSVEVKNIDIDKITIELIEESQGVIFKNGKKVKRIRNEYGGDTFDIFYDNLLIARAGIFKTNWKFIHNYFFYITKNDSIFDFNFKVKGPCCESLYYLIYAKDTINKRLTTVHYDKNGKTGYVGIEYFDDKGNVIVDEGWQNDTLVNLNLYKDVEWHKNYGSRIPPNKLIKEPHNDSLKYIYQTIENGEVVETEIIKVKK